MTKSPWTVVLAGTLAVALLVMLMLPMPVGSAARMVAVALIIALILLLLLHTRAQQGAVRTLTDARDELEERAGRLQQQLSDSKAFNQSVLDGVPDPAVIMDTEYGVRLVNRAARQTLASNGDDGEPLTCFRVLYGRDKPCDPTMHPCVIATGESCKHIQTRVDENGETQLVEMRATPLYDEDGQITGGVEVIHRLNQQERLALRLQRARQDAEAAHVARAQFVATMSHEVRTPLNAVLGMADLLRLTSLTRKQKSYLQIMESSSNMLLSLVDNMIDFSTIESGELELKKDSFHVTDLLERVLEIMGYQAYSKGIELAGAPSYEPDMQVVGDFHRLQQIMINLVGNAIKFTEAGEVTISVGVETADAGNMLLSVSISDTGIGMSKEVGERLFMPFGSIADELDNPNRGSGLGLTISKQLIDLMEGQISLDSELGTGTTVRFTVPVTRIAESDRAVMDGRRVLENRRMLLVEANQAISSSIVRCLSAWGTNCDVEPRLDQVSRRLESAREAGHPFDCIVLDIDSASADRLAVARRIRGHSELPIVLLTSIAQPLEVGQISTIGRVRAVNKPILPSVLQYNLSRLFETDLIEPVAAEDDFQSLRILIAEDNPINRKLLNGMLKSLEFDVDTVNDGLAVLETLEKSSYDLILMDCQMPGMDGDEVTRIIREGKLGDGGQPVVVAITADVSVHHREKCMEAGMDDFLAKPIRLGTLKSGLRRWSLMSNSRRRQQPESAEFVAHDGGDIVAQLQKRAGIADGKALSEFIGLFIDDASTRLDVMRQALVDSDLETIRRECHALKGACLEMGVTGLSGCCDALGSASRERRLDDLPVEFGRLAAEFERVRPIFEEGRSRPG